MHGDGGQATVEWAALVLLAALVLGAAATLAGREQERGLGELVAKRIASGSGEVAAAASERSVSALPAPRAPASVAPPRAHARASPAPHAPVPAPPGPAFPPPARRALDDSRGIRGIGSVARHAWILCLGYRHWRYERDHPITAIEGLPLGEALGIVNDCINPHDYLLED